MRIVHCKNVIVDILTIGKTALQLKEDYLQILKYTTVLGNRIQETIEYRYSL